MHENDDDQIGRAYSRHEKRSACTILVCKKERDHYKVPDICGRITLKWNLGDKMLWCGLD
jgi:hypothetical protein